MQKIAERTKDVIENKGFGVRDSGKRPRAEAVPRPLEGGALATGRQQAGLATLSDELGYSAGKAAAGCHTPKRFAQMQKTSERTEDVVENKGKPL
jgi:hypothetical protein